jgi:hypothetical protein
MRGAFIGAYQRQMGTFGRLKMTDFTEKGVVGDRSGATANLKRLNQLFFAP